MRLSLLGPAVTATPCYQSSLVPPPLRLRFETQFPLTPLGVRELCIVKNAFPDSFSAEQMVKEIRDAGGEDAIISLHRKQHIGTKYGVLEQYENLAMVHRCAEMLAAGFGMTFILKSRLNVYENASMWKPFHFDAHAFADSPKAPSIADKVNTTVIASFGATRQFAIQQEGENLSGDLAIDLTDNTAIAIGRDFNIAARHGILRGVRKPEERTRLRVSLVLNGWVDQEEEVENVE